MTTQPEFYLVAMGSIIHPRITHTIFDVRTEAVESESMKVAGMLSKAGYFTFYLYDAKEEGENQKPLKAFSVKQPEPVVTAFEPRS